MSFDWRDGVHLVGSELWFDAPRAPGLTFVSHAGIRASGPRLLTSPATAKVLRALGRRARPLSPPLGRLLSVGENRVELLASDLISGAALLRVENRAGVAIYAGALGDGAEVRSCDRLCLVAPDPVDGVPIESLPRLVAESAAGAIVVAPGLPEAVAAAHLLAEAGLPVRAHATLRTALRALGLSLPVWRDPVEAGRTLLCSLDFPHAGPPASARASTVRLLPMGASAAVMSAYVRATGATDIVVVGRHAPALVRRLGDEGIEARPISAPDQLVLFAEAAAPGGP